MTPREVDNKVRRVASTTAASSCATGATGAMMAAMRAAALAAGAAALTISVLELREIAISALELREIAISALELREIEPGDRRRLELGQVAKAQPGVGNELDARARHGACVRADGT